MDHEVVSEQDWHTAQSEFHKRELEHSKAGQELAAARRKLPWMKIEKPYTFIGTEGKQTLTDLFQGRNQLIMQHFMFTPGWKEGCQGCSVLADGVDGARYHFEPKGVSFVAVSRAPIEALQAFKERMGWKFKWVSSGESDFSFDFNVSFSKEQLKQGKAFYRSEMRKVDMEDLPNLTAFYKNEKGEIFRTSEGGDDTVLGVYSFLDLTPLGRNEKSFLDWVKHHDKY